MDTFQIDYGSVLIAAILYMVVNFFWYSKWFFGNLWMKLSGVKESDMKHNRLAMLWGFVIALVMAFFLAFFDAFLGVTTVSDGMFVAFCIWLGFVATTQLTPVIWCQSSPKLFLINTGSKLLSLLVMGGILGA